MANGRKVRADEAAELLESWERSGEPMSQWCGARGLNWYSLSAFKGWMRSRRCSSETIDLRFAEVVVEQPAVLEPARYRVELGRVVVEVDDHFRDDTLVRLLRTVTAC